MTLYRNALVYLDDFRFHYTGFCVENGRFAAIGDPAGDAVDLAGAYVLPGLVDIHTHGNSGVDFSDANDDGLRRMAAYLAKNGVTSFCPTSMTLPEPALQAAFATARRFVQAPPPGTARLLGIHMEGPFFSAAKCGAQNPAHLREPDIALLRRLCDGCGDLVRLIDVAPELPGALPFIGEAKAIGTVSVAHTAAGYEQARAAFDAGATHVTHLFNAMPPLLHREPGVIGAAAENPAVCAELIGDGLHVHESAVRAAFRLFGASRICLISDALSVCGMPDGAYHLGDQPVFLSGGIARLSNGTIAGAASNLLQNVQNLVRFGIPVEDAVRAATFNPARAVHAEREAGAIAVSRRADFLVCAPDLTLRRVYLGGSAL